MAIDFDKAIKEYIDSQPEPEKKTPPVPVAVPLERIKGDPVTVFDRFAYNQLSDVVIDCQQYDAINVLVLPTGTSPSATVSVEGAASGLYVPLSTPGAVQPNITTNKSFDVSVSTPFARIRLSDIAGTFVYGQGFTVIVTPYRRGPLGVIDRANYGTITAAEGTVALDVKGCGSAAIQITGTWSATAAFEGTLDDTNWVALFGIVPGTNAMVSSSTANGLWLIPCAGLSQVRVRASAFASGTIVVNLRASVGTQIIHAITGQLDDTDKQAVSVWGKVTAAGDTALLLTAAGGIYAALQDASGNALTSENPSDSITLKRALNVNAHMHVWDGSTNLVRARSVAASGAGLGVQQVGTLGELITLAASAARTASANGTAVTGLGWRNRYIVLFDLTVADTDAGDTLDVYVDVSLDGNTWLNAIHFTQIVGTDAASKRYAVLDPAAPGTSEIVTTSDAAAGAVRPSMFGPQMRARWAIVDAGTDDASFTFSVTSYAI